MGLKPTPVQELYRHLEHYVNGNMHMAYYGMNRARGLSHEDALEDTIEYFDLRNQDWYKKRMESRVGFPDSYSEESHVVELTTDEFDLMRSSLEATVDVFKEASSDPTVPEEDTMIDNEMYLKAVELQKKFPPMGDIVLKEDNDGN